MNETEKSRNIPHFPLRLSKTLEKPMDNLKNLRTLFALTRTTWNYLNLSSRFEQKSKLFSIQFLPFLHLQNRFSRDRTISQTFLPKNDSKNEFSLHQKFPLCSARRRRINWNNFEILFSFFSRDFSSKTQKKIVRFWCATVFLCSLFLASHSWTWPFCELILIDNCLSLSHDR